MPNWTPDSMADYREREERDSEPLSFEAPHPGPYVDAQGIERNAWGWETIDPHEEWKSILAAEARDEAEDARRKLARSEIGQRKAAARRELTGRNR
jgi:hypothetical protein